MAFFISQENLKAKSLIHGNVDPKTLRVIMERVQLEKIESLLGPATYADLLAKTNENPSGLNEVEAILINNYVIPYFIIRVEEMATIHYNFQIRAKSVGTAQDEHATPNNWTDSDKLVNQFTKQAAFYKAKAIDYLKDNLATFTLYKTETEHVDKDKDSEALNWSVATRRVR